IVEGEHVSYAELSARASRLARLLGSRGAGAGPLGGGGLGPHAGPGGGALVGVALDRSADLVAVLLASWMTGAGYLPLDPAYPPDRIGFVLADAAPAVVVTSRRGGARVGGRGGA